MVVIEGSDRGLNKVCNQNKMKHISHVYFHTSFLNVFTQDAVSKTSISMFRKICTKFRKYTHGMKLYQFIHLYNN